MPSPTPSGRAAAGFAAVLVLIGAAVSIDYGRATSEVPALPPPCVFPEDRPASDARTCPAERNEDVAERLRVANAQQTEFDDRLWLYAIAILLAGGVFLGVRARTLPRERLRAAFTDLGVAGVGVVLVTLLLWLVQASSGSLVGVTPTPLLVAGGLYLLVAGLGTAATQPVTRGAGADRAVSSTRAGIPTTVKVGIGFSVASMAIAAVAASGSPGCEAERPDWVDRAFAVALGAAIGSVIAGIVALFQRRWMASIPLIGVAPVWLFVTALASACLS